MLIDIKTEEKLIEYCLDYICKSYKDGYFFDGMKEEKVVRGERMTGNSFQLSLAYEILNSEEFLIRKPILKSLLEEVKLILKNNYATYQFNYFHSTILPDDLDTASSMVRVLYKEIPSITESFRKIISANSENNLVKTWFLSGDNYNTIYFNNTLLFKNKEFFHVDVLLNYLLTEQKLNPSKKTIANAIFFINSIGIENYWYIPRWYSTYLLSKVFYNAKNEITDHYLDFLKGIILSNEKEKFTKVRFHNINSIIDQENNSNNWLNSALKLASLNYYNYLSKNQIHFKEEKILNKINESLDSFNPSLYWTIGVDVYKNKCFSLLLLLDCLKSVKNV